MFNYLCDVPLSFNVLNFFFKYFTFIYLERIEMRMTTMLNKYWLCRAALFVHTGSGIGFLPFQKLHLNVRRRFVQWFGRLGILFLTSFDASQCGKRSQANQPRNTHTNKQIDISFKVCFCSIVFFVNTGLKRFRKTQLRQERREDAGDK